MRFRGRAVDSVGPSLAGAIPCNTSEIPRSSAVTRLSLLDEAFELITLTQTRKLERFPTIVMGESFWEHLRAFIRDTLLAEGTIDEADLEIWRPALTAEDAVRIVREARPLTAA